MPLSSALTAVHASLSSLPTRARRDCFRKTSKETLEALLQVALAARPSFTLIAVFLGEAASTFRVFKNVPAGGV